jgi:hypothetical protein
MCRGADSAAGLWACPRGGVGLHQSSDAPSKMNRSARFPLSPLRRLAAASWPLAILILQNLVVFQNHYFRNFSFPWDFLEGYYAVTAFWTTVASRGMYPAWVPFYAMGMPFDLMLQSGLHYPPLWIFPILHIAYSLHAAVVFQCLHVLFGAIGMFMLLRLVLSDRALGISCALLGAFAFQFFGGFYSNAEHPDIVRAFALAPWLLYALTPRRGETSRLSWRFLFIPGLIILLATGAYPGNIVSGLLVANLYLVFQLLALRSPGTGWMHTLRFGAAILLLEALGAGLAAVHLGPGWFYRDHLMRASQLGLLERFSLGVEHLPALFLDNALVPGEISMTSTFVTLPILILLTFMPVRLLRDHWPMAAAAAFSALMAAGDRTFVGVLLPRLISVLGISRFPSSDYRIFVAIGLIYFAALAAQALLDRGLSWRAFLIRTAVVFSWFALAIQAAYGFPAAGPVVKVTAIGLATLACLAALHASKSPPFRSSLRVILALFVLVALDALRVLPEMTTWQSSSDRRLRLFDVSTSVHETRPPRIEKTTNDYSWEGYITGRFTLNDFVTPNMLNTVPLVLHEPVYKRYMLAAWTPLLLEGIAPEGLASQNVQIVPEGMASEFRAAQSTASVHVRQLRYALNDITYQVSLARPALMIENEMYFPGWSAQLTSSSGATTIQAVSVNGVFRAWQLPAGDYTMLARFEFPHLRLFAGVSLLSLLLWLVLLCRRFRILRR